MKVNYGETHSRGTYRFYGSVLVPYAAYVAGHYCTE